MANNKEKEKSGQPENVNIKIDYDNIDVADIMSQIKRKVALQPKEKDEPPSENKGLILEESKFSPPQPPIRSRSKIRRLLLKIMKPFAPIIKLMILPVHEEFREAVEVLDYANKRLDYYTKYFGFEFQKVGEILGRLERKIDASNQRIDQAFSDLREIQEYTKLLHNLSHNLVVELTKLKIEGENLKIQTRIMEKDFSFLGKKEKELEKIVFK